MLISHFDEETLLISVSRPLSERLLGCRSGLGASLNRPRRSPLRRIAPALGLLILAVVIAFSIAPEGWISAVPGVTQTPTPNGFGFLDAVTRRAVSDDGHQIADSADPDRNLVGNLHRKLGLDFAEQLNLEQAVDAKVEQQVAFRLDGRRRPTGEPFQSVAPLP